MSHSIYNILYPIPTETKASNIQNRLSVSLIFVQDKQLLVKKRTSFRL